MYGKIQKNGAVLITLASAICMQLSACGGNGSTSTMSGSTTGTVQTGQVTLANNKLLRNGKAWMPHGFFQVAFEDEPNDPQDKTYEENASQGYTPAEYADMVSAHADSVRLMISQPGADPQNALYSQALVKQVIGAVQAARAVGLTAIVSIQDELITGEPQASMAGLPNAATLRVWQQLVPSFKNDTGIMLELFNEPVIEGSMSGNTPTAAEWQMWQTAHNMTIASIRSQGATNVLIADGLVTGRILTGAPALTDPLDLMVYSAHPYSLSASDETSAFLDLSFGNFSATHPVIITEWGQGYSCIQPNPAFATMDPAFLITFLNYLQSKNIGLEMGSWDWGGPTSFGNVRYGFPATPLISTFNVNGTEQMCGNADRGPGKTILQWYATGVVPANAL